jgi:MFS superfamily sulfate permease-like transporter
MYHGAGGLQAQYRFGARTGMAPIIFGVLVLVLAVGFADHAAALFAIIPIGAVGALLILAGTDLASSRRLFDGKPSCGWVIGVTALVTLTINPALGLVLGWIAEFIRAAIVRRLIPERTNLRGVELSPWSLRYRNHSAGTMAGPGRAMRSTRSEASRQAKPLIRNANR